MTREKYAKEHLPELKTLLEAVINDWHEGRIVRIRVSENDFRDGLLPWWKRYCARQYNALIIHLGILRQDGSYHKSSPMFENVTIQIPVLN